MNFLDFLSSFVTLTDKDPRTPKGQKFLDFANNALGTNYKKLPPGSSTVIKDAKPTGKLK
jgi:hypothetical protein